MMEIKQDGILTAEEGYELTRKYVSYFWRVGKYYSLKTEYEMEDVISIIYLKMLERDYFSRYDSSVTSKAYFMQRCVSTKMVDLLRKHRDLKSLETPVNEDGMTLMDVLEDKSLAMESVCEGNLQRDKILEQLPTVSSSKIRGYCEVLGREVGVNYRDIAEMLEVGLKASDMAEFLKNPRSGMSISEGSVSKYIRDLREYVLNNIVIA